MSVGPAIEMADLRDDVALAFLDLPVMLTEGGRQ